MLDFSCEQDIFNQGYNFLGAIDEAGRGPLAGPVVAACVIVSPGFKLNKGLKGVRDSKKATERNRIKRRIREVIGSELGKLKTGFDVIIISLPAIKDAGYQEIEKSIIKHFKKLGLYK